MNPSDWRKDNSGCVFYHRLRHSSRARGFVRKLQYVACRIRDRYVRRALVHADVDAVHYCATRRNARQ